MENFVEFLKYIILGLVQGATEPLPISSSGHMVIVNSIFKDILPVTAMNNFQIIVNFASLIAIIFYYRILLKQIIIGSFNYVFKKNKESKKDFLYLVYIIIATIPAGIVGIIIKLYEIDQFFTNILCVGISLFITGNLLLFIHHQAPSADREEITLKDSLLMGFAQAIGLLPGISRSGVTTSFGVANKVKLSAALRFSFMLYIPASIGAAFIGVYDLTTSEVSPLDSGLFLGYVGAFIASLIATYYAIKFFFKLVRNQNLKYFGYYCIILSIVVIALIATGVFTWR